jgi:hypothetical protein
MSPHRWGARGVAGAVSLALAVAVGGAPRPAVAQELTWFGSLGYAEGTYIFADRYRTFSWLNTLALRTGRLTVSGSLPVWSQNGTVVSQVAGVPVPTGGPDQLVVQQRRPGEVIAGRGRRRAGAPVPAVASQRLAPDARWMLLADTTADSSLVSGTDDYVVHVADPMFGGTFSVFEGGGTFRSLSLEAWAKAPLATVASGVGTGSWDVGAGASVTMGARSLFLTTSATWWRLGDMPSLPLNDVVMYAVAAGGTIGRGWSLMSSAAASTRMFSGTQPPASVTVTLSRETSRGSSVNVSAGAGLTESAADLTLGVGWSARLLGRSR